ncbi:MAG: nicotinate phosphoribosyltransferase [Clostridia bacterium]|nr:nicotinate phosphoribosyltransferase [Clostridia bacterium]
MTKMKDGLNLTMLTDFYEITMTNGYFEHGLKDKIVCFDMFFRRVPDNGGFALMMGLEQLIDYIKNLSFDDEDIEYLKRRKIFSDEFLDYLKNFKFSSDVWAVEEGTPIFPHEPIVKVIGPAIEAQFIETMVLLTINHQCLIGTKTNRIVRAAKGRPVMEFGSRRAQGPNGAIEGARAAYIAGCAGTACTISDIIYKTPALGTMAHSWIQMFDTEYDAFMAYAKVYPDNCTLLVDTYNVLKSGIPNAIKVFKEYLIPNGYKNGGIRIDSGDITYLTKKARKMLDDAGLDNIKIVISNSLDEYIIRDLLVQGAEIDSFGVGERLITSKSEPVFGGVYKLASVYDGDVEIPKIKLSENVEKITNPCNKKLVRLYSKETNKAIADVLLLNDEPTPDGSDYEIFDPNHTWKRKTVTDYYAKELLVPIFKEGKCVYKSPDIEAIRKYCKEQVETLWDEVKRFENPHDYYVDLSQKLWDIKHKLLSEHK